MFDSDLDRYYRDGWERDVVASADTVDGTPVTLHCGNELSGVIHVADGDSSGTGHQINRDGSDDADLATCFRRTVSLGTVSEDKGRLLATRHYGQSGARSYVRFGTDGLTYTMYTSTTAAGGTDWSGCAR